MTDVGASPVCVAYALAHFAPEFFESLTPAEQFVLPWMPELWARPEQLIPGHDWRSCSFIGGRGFGKSYTIATYINREIEAGRLRALVLMAPTEDRVDEVQIQFLIDTSPPWFKARRERGTVVWPNGVEAEIKTPGAPGRSRSSNYELAWMTELVDWPASTREEAFKNAATATRKGRSQIIIDTTSMGKASDLIAMLEDQHKADPTNHVIIRGTIFDNPLFSKKYLQSVWRQYRGRRREEELFGRVFREAAGALWNQDKIDLERRPAPPERPELVIVACDPALSPDPNADETGIITGGRGRDGHSYILADDSGHHEPTNTAKIVVSRCAVDAAGVLIERNAGGSWVSAAMIAEAKTRGMTWEMLPRDKPFPKRRPGHIYIKELMSRGSKGERASGPATETDAGRVHIVGEMPELELELTTFVPGVTGQPSPNRYDAFNMAVCELAGLERETGARPSEDMRQSKVAADALRDALRGSGGRVGL